MRLNCLSTSPSPTENLHQRQNMLVLSRKLNEAIRIGGDISIRVVRIDRDTVRLGVSAPRDIGVHREEVYLEQLKAEAANQL